MTSYGCLHSSLLCLTLCQRHNGLDTGSSFVIDDTAVDVVAGAGAAFMSQFFGTEEEVSATTEVLESGTLLFILEYARKATVELVAWLARIIAALL